MITTFLRPYALKPSGTNELDACGDEARACACAARFLGPIRGSVDGADLLARRSVTTYPDGYDSTRLAGTLLAEVGNGVCFAPR